jgi:hypothetical protein
MRTDPSAGLSRSMRGLDKFVFDAIPEVLDFVPRVQAGAEPKTDSQRSSKCNAGTEVSDHQQPDELPARWSIVHSLAPSATRAIAAIRYASSEQTVGWDAHAASLPVTSMSMRRSRRDCANEPVGWPAAHGLSHEASRLIFTSDHELLPFDGLA